MKTHILLPVLLAAGLFQGCKGAGASAIQGSRPASEPLLLTNATIYTEARGETVEALGVRDGRVLAAGREDEVRAALGPGAREVDLGGRFVVPGLMDGHGHIEGLGEALESVDLVGSASYDEVIERIVARAHELPAGTWVTGRGWDQTRWPENAFPHHAELSRRVPDHPVLVRRVDGHAALANARALELAGLLEADPLPTVEGGDVRVDANGRPSGVLIDTAIGLVGRHVPVADEDTVRRRILRAQEALLALGLVAVHDMGIGGSEARIYEELERSGALKLRVVAYLWGNEGIEPELAERYPRPSDGDPSRKLRIIGAKLMLDGALGSRGAALLEEYTDAPGERGLARFSAEAFQERLDEIVDAGLQPATHAIGDRANRMLLDAYQSRMERDPEFARMRPRVEHAQVVSEADWDRYEDLGVQPSMQPTHATSDMRWAEARLGSERVRGAYAWRKLLPDPALIAFGSDFPVEHPDPLEGLYAARTRMDKEGRPEGGWRPEESLSGAEALSGFTLGVARAAHEEHARGTLLPGWFADLVVLDIDPVRGPAEALLDARVYMTVVDGEIVYRADD